MRILIAETELALAADLQRAFEAAGSEVTAVSNSFTAWDLLASDPPDLLVTRLSFGTGEVPGTALGASASAKQIPVVYLAADPSYAAYATAADGAVLIRPVEAADLVARAQRLLADQAPRTQTVPKQRDAAGS